LIVVSIEASNSIRERGFVAAKSVQPTFSTSGYRNEKPTCTVKATRTRITIFNDNKSKLLGRVNRSKNNNEYETMRRRKEVVSVEVLAKERKDSSHRKSKRKKYSLITRRSISRGRIDLHNTKRKRKIDWRID